ncbi:antitoxin [Streptomyces sp. TRM49041]|uniref:antitoxin n=1 Tax=Streptomyces sp. TRM49041 TaxID=2603216 RepID=UPI0011EBE99C|nr:antitoxin [Streptomyces sp. TRM49041]
MFDSLKNLKDKAEDLAADHGEAIAQGLEKAGDFVDEKTGGKFSSQIETGVDTAQDLVERLGQRKSVD